jgi:anti-sigma factor RsiW
MNCRDAEPLLFAERDGALPPAQRTILEQHVAECPACRRVRADLAEAAVSLRTATAQAALPDVDEEWLTLRDRLHEERRLPAGRRKVATIAWLAVPLAAAAALAVVFWSGPFNSGSGEEAKNNAEIARAEYVEVKDAAASAMVYVDKESGWLVVWAVDSSAKG